MTDDKLIEKAYEAMKNAYAPYSGFCVGAAAYAGGKVYTGCNIENSSYGATICAERCAIFKAVSDGNKKIESVAIVSSSGGYTMPCGICRQVMAEFMPKGSVIVTDGTTIKKYSVEELLPGNFTLPDRKGNTNG